jgi:hypothetical protein
MHGGVLPKPDILKSYRQRNLNLAIQSAMELVLDRSLGHGSP